MVGRKLPPMPIKAQPAMLTAGPGATASSTAPAMQPNTPSMSTRRRPCRLTARSPSRPTRIAPIAMALACRPTVR